MNMTKTRTREQRVASLSDEVQLACERRLEESGDSLSRSEVIGILETVKATLLAHWIETVEED